MPAKTMARLLLSTAALIASHPAIAQEVKLTTDQIKSEVVGKSLDGLTGDGRTLWIKVGKDGTAWGKLGGRDFTMDYEIKDGKWCRTISGRGTACQEVKKDGSALKFYNEDGTLSSSVRADN